MAQDVFLSMIYLGNYADIDTNESNAATENESSLLGTYGSPSAPLSQNITSVESDSPTRFIDADHDTGNGELTYDVGAGTVTVGLDSFVTYFGTVNYADGSTDDIAIDILQMTNGDVFMPAWDDYPQFGEKAIDSITLNSVEFDRWGGFEQSSYDSVTFVCFAAGTRICTPDGAVPVETLAVGDLVMTLDRGPQQILWTGHRKLRFPPSPETQKPIELKKDCIKPGYPRRDLVVSPQHRVLWAGEASQHREDRKEVFVPAHCLTSLRGIRRKAGCRQVAYHTLLLDRHEIIFAEGIGVESFFPGTLGLGTLGPFDRLRLSVALPRFRRLSRSGYGPMARAQIPNKQARSLCKSGPAQVVCAGDTVALHPAPCSISGCGAG